MYFVLCKQLTQVNEVVDLKNSWLCSFQEMWNVNLLMAHDGRRPIAICHQKERKACYGSKVRHYIISGIIFFCIKSFYPITWMFRIECAKRTTLYHRCVRKCIRNFLTCSPNVKSNHFHTSYNETRFTQMFYFLDYFDKYMRIIYTSQT